MSAPLGGSGDSILRMDGSGNGMRVKGMQPAVAAADREYRNRAVMTKMMKTSPMEELAYDL